MTAAAKRRVSISAGAGMSHEEIALGLGIARNTLEKHFARELAIGAYERRMDVLDALYRAATGDKPSAAAGRAYLALTPAIAAPPLPPPPDQSKEKPEKLGKKEIADREASTAERGTNWEDDLSPRRRTVQ